MTGAPLKVSRTLVFPGCTVGITETPAGAPTRANELALTGAGLIGALKLTVMLRIIERWPVPSSITTEAVTVGVGPDWPAMVMGLVAEPELLPSKATNVTVRGVVADAPPALR